MTEIRALTSLRAFAALLVLFHHFLLFGIYPSLRANPLEAILMEGHIGVTIFFVLSGYLITSRYFKPMTEGQLGWFDYLTKRVARIWPLYLAVLLLTLILEPKTVFMPLVQLTLTQGYFIELRFSGIPTAWSLTVEETYYLIAPIVFITIAYLSAKAAIRLKRAFVVQAMVLLVWVIGMIAVGFGLAALSSSIPPPRFGGLMVMDWPQIRALTIFGRFFEFAVGIACALLFGSGRVTRLFDRKYGSVLADGLSVGSLGAIALASYLMNRAGGAYSDGWIYNYPIAVLTGIWILALTCERSIIARFMSLELLVYLGRISYAVYLLQFLVYYEVIQNLLSRESPLYMLLLIVIMNVASALAYELIEKPCRRLVIRAAEHLKRWLKLPAKAPVEAS